MADQSSFDMEFTDDELELEMEPQPDSKPAAKTDTKKPKGKKEPAKRPDPKSRRGRKVIEDEDSEDDSEIVEAPIPSRGKAPKKKSDKPANDQNTEKDKPEKEAGKEERQTAVTFPPALMVRLLGQFAFKNSDTKMTAQTLDAFTEYIRIFTTEAIWRSEQVMRQEQEIAENDDDANIMQERHLQKVMADISLDF